MTATFLMVSVSFILLGSAFLIYSQKIGVGFCKFAKWSWKKATLGLTDMRWFYQEEGAPGVFRALGAFLVLGGIAFLIFVSLSFFGPGSLFAMREAANYLEEKYEDCRGGLSISAQKEGENATFVRISYRCGDRSGNLKGQWDGKRYQFTEVE
jgi:hypothetical protein